MYLLKAIAFCCAMVAAAIPFSFEQDSLTRCQVGNYTERNACHHETVQNLHSKLAVCWGIALALFAVSVSGRRPTILEKYGLTAPEWEKDDQTFFCHGANGKLHKLNGPAVISFDQAERVIREVWYHEGQLHRVGGPAITEANGSYEYWFEGKRQSSHDKPAVHTKYRDEWYEEDLLHRIDGPAIIVTREKPVQPVFSFLEPDKTEKICEEWHERGQRHRRDEPAVICYRNGHIIRAEWWAYGKRHRTNGPAVWSEEGADEFWENGVRVK